MQISQTTSAISYRGPFRCKSNILLVKCRLISERTACGPEADVQALTAGCTERVDAAMDTLQFPTALTEIWKGISRMNKYIDETAPWLLAKSENPEDRKCLSGVMYTLLEGIRIVSILIEPFMPDTPRKIQSQLGLEGREEILNWKSASSWGLYPDGAEVHKGEVLFPRIDPEA